MPGQDDLHVVPLLLDSTPKSSDHIAQASNFADGCHLNSNLSNVEARLRQLQDTDATMSNCRFMLWPFKLGESTSPWAASGAGSSKRTSYFALKLHAHLLHDCRATPAMADSIDAMMAQDYAASIMHR